MNTPADKHPGNASQSRLRQSPIQSSQAEKRSDPSGTRARILASAARLFREKGFQRTTVRDLAGAVGIQSGSLFHHFRNKDEILFSVMEEGILDMTHRLRATLAETEGPEQRLLALIHAELESLHGGTGDAMTVLFNEWRSLSPESQSYMLELREIYEMIWLQGLTDAQEAGLLAVEPAILRRLLSGALAWSINWYQPKGELTLDELAEMALTLAIKQADRE